MLRCLGKAEEEWHERVPSLATFSLRDVVHRSCVIFPEGRWDAGRKMYRARATTLLTLRSRTPDQMCISRHNCGLTIRVCKMLATHSDPA